MLAGSRRRQCDLTMQIVGYPNHHQIQFIHVEQLAIVLKGIWDGMLFRKLLCLVFARRRHRNQLRVRTSFQRIDMDRTDETRTDEAYSNFARHTYWKLELLCMLEVGC